MIFSWWWLQGDTSSRVTVELEDAFGRMLVHGLAQFHGLMSCSSKGLDCSVAVHFRPQQQAEPEAPAHPQITWWVP